MLSYSYGFENQSVIHVFSIFIVISETFFSLYTTILSLISIGLFKRCECNQYTFSKVLNIWTGYFMRPLVLYFQVIRVAVNIDTMLEPCYLCFSVLFVSLFLGAYRMWSDLVNFVGRLCLLSIHPVLQKKKNWIFF